MIALNDAAETVSAVQLQEMADELSIEPSVLASAVSTWHRERTKAKEKRDRRKAFYRWQLIPFLALNTFLILLDISLAGTITWAIYPLLGTGISLFFNPCSQNSGTRLFGTQSPES
ncbi:MAG: 2TM domain-containing protein [Phormidesmis sp.]